MYPSPTVSNVTFISKIVEHAIAKQLPEGKRFATATPVYLQPPALDKKNRHITVSLRLSATVHETKH